jgi:hypothetical protein
MICEYTQTSEYMHIRCSLPLKPLALRLRLCKSRQQALREVQPSGPGSMPIVSQQQGQKAWYYNRLISPLLQNTAIKPLL